MRLPKIGDKIYIVSCRRNVCRIGEIREIFVGEQIEFTIDWIINPSPDGNKLSYFSFRFETWPVTFHLNSDVFITFDEQEFTRLLKEKLCLKE